MSVKPATKTFLAFRSGDRCAFTGCGVHLTVDGSGIEDAAIIGEAAHIAGEKEGSARFDPSMTEEERNRSTNLIYLCATHHTLIDKQPQKFPLAELQAMKCAHETKVREGITYAFAEIGFTELATACQWVTRIQPAELETDYSLTPPAEKVSRNQISSEASILIKVGLSVARLVKSFVEKETETDPEFPERLRAGFLQKYYEFIGLGRKGTELFYLMCSFAQAGMKDDTKRSAGLAVLMYLFENCEVFEK
jgi:HNH endonuclease